MNKRGIIRIIEVSLAIVVIAGVLIFLGVRNNATKEPDLLPLIPPLLDEIAKDNSLRQMILESPNDPNTEQVVEEFIINKLNNAGINVGVEICDVDVVCPISPYPDNIQGGIYSSDRVILDYEGSASMLESKKLKIFLWRKEVLG